MHTQPQNPHISVHTRHKRQRGKELMEEKRASSYLCYTVSPGSLHVIDFNKKSRQDVLKQERRKYGGGETN